MLHCLLDSFRPRLSPDDGASEFSDHHDLNPEDASYLFVVPKPSNPPQHCEEEGICADLVLAPPPA